MLNGKYEYLNEFERSIVDRYDMKGTIICPFHNTIEIYRKDIQADVSYARRIDKYQVYVYRKNKPIYAQGYFEMTFNQAIRKLDEYFPQKKVVQIDMEL